MHVLLNTQCKHLYYENTYEYTGIFLYSGVFLYIVISNGKIFSFWDDFLKDAAFCFPGQRVYLHLMSG